MLSRDRVSVKRLSKVELPSGGAVRRESKLVLSTLVFSHRDSVGYMFPAMVCLPKLDQSQAYD